MGSSKQWKATELQVCRALAGWWDPKFKGAKVRAEELPFRRTPNSGGWGGHVDMKADIQGPQGWPFSIEIKAQKRWSFDEIVRGRSKLLDQWWGQSCKAAKKSDRTPLLVFTKPRMGFYVRADMRMLASLPKVVASRLLRSRLMRKGPVLYFRMEDFLEALPASSVRECGKRIAAVGA